MVRGSELLLTIKRTSMPIGHCAAPHECFVSLQKLWKDYTEAVKRLIKCVTILFVVVTFLMPLLECFDRWDRPGLSNDTEFPVFLVMLFIFLVLLAVVVIARRFHQDLSDVVSIEIRYEMLRTITRQFKVFVVNPFLIPPLRI